MDTALANPRRTKLDVWPSRRPADTEAEQAAGTAEAEASLSEDELAAR